MTESGQRRGKWWCACVRVIDDNAEKKADGVLEEQQKGNRECVWWW